MLYAVQYAETMLWKLSLMIQKLTQLCFFKDSLSSIVMEANTEEIETAMTWWMTTGVKVVDLQVLISNTIWKETAQEARKGT